VVERHGSTRVITFFYDGVIEAGKSVSLDGDAAQHARVRRSAPNDQARVVDGRGRVGQGRIAEMGKKGLLVALEAVEDVPRPLALDVIAPVADRDRMLLAAEKCAELQVSVWRPAMFARSRSVSPRGEGPKFREKVLARMRSALEQSGGAWVPEVFEESEPAEALGAYSTEWTRLVLDSQGTSIVDHISHGRTVIAVGPEGGFEGPELELATATGWTRVSLGTTTLRFETAIIAAVAIARSESAGAPRRR
jgi:16S rRNA (uracil1498-N3)-methyltransferase